MFDRLELLIGKYNVDILKTKKILVIGLGGVGGYVVEALVRTGIENIDIVDYDKIELSNINRQIISLHSNIGKKKTDVFKERILDINPDAQVKVIDLFLDSDNIDSIINDYDYVIDACDTVSAKKNIIRTCIKKSIPFISCMGTGKKLDPSKLEIVDIRKTSYDPLAKIIRKFIRDEKIRNKVMVLTSKETIKNTNTDVIPSAIFVPATAGLLIANYVIRDILNI